MGEAGRKFALHRFDASVMVDALDRLYHQIAVSPSHQRGPTRAGA
jgi:hypothetical protein